MERLIIFHCPIPATLVDIYQTNIKLNILFNIWMFLTSSLFITMYTQIYIYTYSSFQWMTIYWCSHYAFKIHLKRSRFYEILYLCYKYFELLYYSFLQILNLSLNLLICYLLKKAYLFNKVDVAMYKVTLFS